MARSDGTQSWSSLAYAAWRKCPQPRLDPVVASRPGPSGGERRHGITGSSSRRTTLRRAAVFAPPPSAPAGRFRRGARATRAPIGNDLTVDAATLGAPDASRLLVVSSGLHGVEGPFGSAVQTAATAAVALDDHRRVRQRPSDIRAPFSSRAEPVRVCVVATDRQPERRCQSQPASPGGSRTPVTRRRIASSIGCSTPAGRPRPGACFRCACCVAIARHGRPQLKAGARDRAVRFSEGPVLRRHRTYRDQSAC